MFVLFAFPSLNRQIMCFGLLSLLVLPAILRVYLLSVAYILRQKTSLHTVLAYLFTIIQDGPLDAYGHGSW